MAETEFRSSGAHRCRLQEEPESPAALSPAGNHRAAAAREKNYHRLPVFRELGFNFRLTTGADHSVLKRGVKEANISDCAPMQLYHGLTSQMADAAVDFIFLPMVRSLPRVGNEPYSKVCPVVQASPWILRRDLAAKLNPNSDTTGRADCSHPAVERSGALDGRRKVRWHPELKAPQPRVA